MMLGQGVYSLPEAARLTGLSQGRVREWFRGRRSLEARRPVFRGDYPLIDGDRAISFHDLIELFVGGQLRENGLSLQRLRKVHKQLQEEWKTRHPFCRHEILLSRDGKKVFTRGLDEVGRSEVIEVLTHQRVFAEILLPFLKRIDYDDATKLAKRWFIANHVVVDPEICFGKPVVDTVGISTITLSGAYYANGQKCDVVAEWFSVSPEVVRAAVDFERRLAA